ncbi:MAG: MBOAT family protein [Clostridia bacterium]|nr:MBOAT family protein [Clostridia bacterium]
MLFTSLEFLFLFFPITMGINYLLPAKARNYWLLIASLFFYAWGEPAFVVVMLASIIFNYFMAIRVAETKRGDRHSKIMLAIAIVGNLGLLFVYKYMNFATGTLHSILPFTRELFEQTKFVLPIGISFFTFQSLSYVIDVYRGVPVQKNPFYVGLYVSLFPQLIAGPIVRYTTIADEINHRVVTIDSFTKGMYRFLKGFNKKVLLANVLAQLADFAFESGELTVSLAWVGIIAYALQIFFDFSGYSEMAIGIGQMLGFNFLENFNYPYISKTITEFWRRWHMSLGTWFRDYLYFPLGGSRVKSKWRLVFNLAVVWLATGIWHGASWNFILWGALYGVLLIFEKLTKLPEKVEKHLGLRIPYQVLTMVMVLLGWVLFRAIDLGSALDYMKAMFGFAPGGFIDGTSIMYIRDYLVMLIAGIVCSTPLIGFVSSKLRVKVQWIDKAMHFGGYLVQTVLFIVSVSFIVMNAHNPFIYFNF